MANWELNRKEFYFTELRPKNPDDNRIREMIRKRKASVSLQCHECNEAIKKNEFYIRDKFWYGADSYGFGGFDVQIRTKVNFICLKCWRSDVPEGTSKNWKRS